MLTIDRTLNAIWRVRKPRPLAQRVLVYWAALDARAAAARRQPDLTSYAVSASRGLVEAMPGGVALRARRDRVRAAGRRHGGAVPLHPEHPRAAGARLGRRPVRRRRVRDRQARAQRGTSSLVPTYSVIYGAFATLPIFLLWIYLGWVVVLLGAVIAAYAPSLAMRVVACARHAGLPLRAGGRAAARAAARRAWRRSAAWRCTSWPAPCVSIRCRSSPCSSC